MKLAIHFAFVVALALVFGCSADRAPVDPIWGKQPCSHCHMLLSDPKTAAQLQSSTGEPLYFDDVGCAVEHVLNEQGVIGRLWVRDERGHWQSALQARYARGHQTPMGYGIAVQADGPLDFAQVQRDIAQKRDLRSER